MAVELLEWESSVLEIISRIPGNQVPWELRFLIALAAKSEPTRGCIGIPTDGPLIAAHAAALSLEWAEPFGAPCTFARLDLLGAGK